MKKSMLWLTVAVSGLGLVVGSSALAATKKPLPTVQADQTESAQAQFNDPGKMIQVTSDKPEIVLVIKSNPTTGYTWFLNQYNSDLVTPVSHRYVPSKSALVGAGGREEWVFKVNSKAFSVPQLTHITFQSVRPWAVSSNNQSMDFTVAIGSTSDSKK